MAEGRRSPSAAALLNLTGLGLGCAYCLPAGTYSIVGEFPTADPSVSSNVLESGFVHTNGLYVVSS